MSLATNVSELATAVATEVKRNRTWINGNASDLSSLSTTAKTDLVSAINEVASSAASATGINDAATSTTSTWSSSKISDTIDAIDPGAIIDDTTPSTTTVYSSSKTDSQIASVSKPASSITGLAMVATSGSYTDLSAKPTIPASYSDLTGTVPQSALPAVALTEFLGAVASQSAMLALTGQRGDWCTRTDLGTDWQLIADDPTALANWREHVYPASPVSSVNGRMGAVTGLSEASDVGDVSTDFASIFASGLV